MMWRRAVMAISLPLATLCAFYLFGVAAELQAIGAHDYASIQVALGLCMAAWAALAICWLIWSPSHQEWFGDDEEEEGSSMTSEQEL